MIDPDDPEESKRWAPFFERMNSIVIPNTVSLIETCRNKNIEVIFARIACLKEDGRDRSLSQKKPGWNYLLMPKDSEESQFVPEIVPKNDLLSRCLFSWNDLFYSMMVFVVLFFLANGGFQVFLCLQQSWNNQKLKILWYLGLTDEEEDAIVAFMMTLSDGFAPWNE